MIPNYNSAMKYHKCITNKDSNCLGREKFPVNGKIVCCREEIEDEYLIAQGVLDAIDEYSSTHNAIMRICSRISYASDVINKHADLNRSEVLPELKRFAILIYECIGRILEDNNLLQLLHSFMQVIRNWFNHSFMQLYAHSDASGVFTDSIKSDLQTLEMALGVCVLFPSMDDNMDDIFF